MLTSARWDTTACKTWRKRPSWYRFTILSKALRSQAGYVGALGSRRTHERRKAQLREQGFREADLARIHTPVGLDLGSRTPEEIALSILAEMVAVRRGRDGRPLSEKRPPIGGDSSGE